MLHDSRAVVSTELILCQHVISAQAFCTGYLHLSQQRDQLVAGVFQTLFGDLFAKQVQVFDQLGHGVKALVLQKVKQADGVQHSALHFLIGSSDRNAAVSRQRKIVEYVDQQTAGNHVIIE